MNNISQNHIDKSKIPQDVMWVCEMLSKNDFDSYLVGGCVRDIFLSREPKDWDVTHKTAPFGLVKHK
jgi:tRNA nucleotidyltransferase/poly(A) polymerase